MLELLVARAILLRTLAKQYLIRSPANTKKAPKTSRKTGIYR
jgi:hypothetical protein